MKTEEPSTSIPLVNVEVKPGVKEHDGKRVIVREQLVCYNFIITLMNNGNHQWKRKTLRDKNNIKLIEKRYDNRDRSSGLSYGLKHDSSIFTF